MANNDHGWKRPHGGRKGGADYVGTQGIGHEDWNFANDVWKDGRYHLYVTNPPKGFDEGSFNFVLGAHAAPAPFILAFVENATYGLSELPEQVLLRRAQEVFALNEDGSLGPFYGNKSVEKIAKRLRQETNHYCVSVAPHDLHVLAQPVPMPSDIYVVKYPGYRPLPMTEDQYASVKKRILLKDTSRSVDQEDETSFPEGQLVERLHMSRERSRRVVELAKKQFIGTHGHLFCEACGLEPARHFGSEKMRNRVIEAHHDVPLSDDSHQGKTKVTDLKMVCPTCHRAIHTIRPWITVDALKKRLKSKS